MHERLKILFIFVDGLGLGGDDPEINPVRRPRFPFLQKLLSFAVPLDACLGVTGLPQSATGQATLFTGINAAAAMGRHIEGFPPPKLKALIEQENLFRKLIRLGRCCTFANAYFTDDPHRIPLRRQSVTTVMSLSALGNVRGRSELSDGKAVCHDITRRSMHSRGYEGEPISPEIAAEHLLATAEENDFTLFEYFLTDRAGHACDRALAEQYLDTLDRFLKAASTFAEHPGRLLLLSSDHGNIEDLSIPTHTVNPVPLAALGRGTERFQALRSLTDVTPAIIDHFRCG